MAKKKIGYWKWGAMALPLALVLGILFYNNSEQFSGTGKKIPSFKVSELQDPDSATGVIPANDPEPQSSEEKKKETEVPKKKPEIKEKSPKLKSTTPPAPVESPKKLAFSFKSPKIICPLKTEPLLYVILQVELLYSAEKLKEELKFRETDVKGIIQNIIYQSEREELKAETIREKILNSLNQLLNHGSIGDLIFRDFKIEIRKK